MAYKGSLFQILNDDGSVKGELVFDAIVSEGHEVENKVTEFPIDSGFVVSDHVIRKNRMLKMEVVSVRHAFKGRQRDGLTSGAHNKIKDDFDILTEMVQKGIRCNIVTILGAYLNCVVTKMKTKQDVETSTILQANIVIREMNVVGVDVSASRQALIDTANEIDVPDPDAALKELLGDDYDELGREA
ncbi:MAG: hypothetical protein HRU12_10055 [Phaeodactylibacter sp.]|nr:hypothetical protein [Phaeodactylibacter sp.]